MESASVRIQADSAAAGAKADELRKLVEEKSQETAKSQAAGKSLQRLVEQAQAQIKRLEKDLQSVERSKEDGTQRVAGALAESEKLREELREKDAELSRLEFACDQAKDRASSVKEQLQVANGKAVAAQKELDSNHVQMRAISEEKERCRIQVEELERSLAQKDTQIATQIKASVGSCSMPHS